MIKQYQSPLEQLIRQQQYSRHLQRIDSILTRSKTAEHLHQTERKPKQYFGIKKQRISQIEAQNSKLHNKLQSIKDRKISSERFKTLSDRKNSPFKKNERKRIQEQNMKMIDKMIAMKNVNSYQKIQKNVQQYNRIKTLLKTNRNTSVKLPVFKVIEPQQKIVQ